MDNTYIFSLHNCARTNNMWQRNNFTSARNSQNVIICQIVQTYVLLVSDSELIDV